MKTSTHTGKINLTFLALTFVVVVSTTCLLSCNQSKVSQSLSPTSAVTNPDTNVVAVKKSKGAGRKDSVSSNVNPNLPQPGSCPGYKEESQYVANYWQFEYLPRDRQGKYLVLLGEYPGISLTTLHDTYCFRRAVCGDYQIQDFINAKFSENQLLISIGWRNDDRTAWQVFWGTGTVGYGMPTNWRTNAPNYAQKVLGFWMDEPSGLISADSMQKISNVIHADGSKLWLEDYDTSPLPSNQNFGIPHNYHVWDQSMLSSADYISCNGNTSSWVSGANFFGDNVLGIDYVEFQGAFGNKFCMIACQPMDGSGALMNDALMYNWLNSYSNVNNFAYYIATGNAKISDGDLNARLAGLNNFMNDAYNAGFLGYQYRCYNYTYVCQTNCVNFTPPNCPVPPSPNNVGAGSPVYWGVWTNNAYYRGPVDPSTPGATICWILQSTAPTSQVTYVHP